MEYPTSLPVSDDKILETAVAEIGTIALRGKSKGSGYIYFANEVRAVLEKFSNERELGKRKG
jgi:hypothetical protein